ncbi:hypothetical protein GH714_016742 [Hevea brasiliensis]|uniref:Rx N-terminal domain-containing protein n=1 Tax=Hevea brasiliensis TaxID=3981 RepID=A0A6A6N4W1_HEVBR|nr:hypothetical protein GH714_016742 [Hevea brasiliensis]
MAEAILSGIAVEIIQKLGSRVLQETRLWWGVKGELEKLRRTVSTIQAVLHDAEQQYWQSHQVKDWVDSLKDAFYDADDLLDEFSTDVLVKQMMSTGNKMVKEVRLFLSSSNPFVYGLKMAHKIGKVRSKLDEIVANRNFHLENLPEKTFPMVEEREQTHSSLPQVVVGRENDKKEVIDFLLSSSYRENVSIISIVGLGGLGKTTLAKLAYNDDMVKSNFELKIKGIEILPDSIIKLRNLQTLYLYGCEKLKQLPKHVKRLVNLRDLGISGCVSLTHMPRGIGQLTSLEYLTTFMAKDNGVSKHGGGLSELRYLNNLRRELEIFNLHKKSLEDILKMKISVSRSTSSGSSISPSQLKILQIENIEDLEFLPEELLANLTSLRRLNLRYCPRITNVSSALRHLTSLERLVFFACEDLDLFDSEDHSDMPWEYLRSLEQLIFADLFKLASLPKGLQHVPTLRKLTIDNCPNLIS